MWRLGRSTATVPQTLSNNGTMKHICGLRFVSAPRSSSTRSCDWCDRLAIALVCLRAVVQVVWGRFTLAYAELSSLLVPQFAYALVIAGSILLIVVRKRSGNLIGSIVLALCIAVIQFTSSQAKNDVLAIDLLLLFAVSHMDPRRLCRSYGLALLFSIVVLMLGSLAGLLFMADDVPNGSLVYSYGFGHPNTPGGLLLSAIGALTYAYWDGGKWPVPFVLAAVCAIFAKLFLSSNSSAILLLAFACMNIAGHRVRTKRSRYLPRKVYIGLLLAVPAILASLMIILTINYKAFPRIAEVVNDLTHLRPYFAHNYLETNGGLTMFGRPYGAISHFRSGNYFSSVDCSYSFLVLVFGLATLFVCALVYARAVVRLGKSEERTFVMFSIILYAFYAVVETYPLYLFSNFTLILLACPPQKMYKSSDYVSSEPARSESWCVRESSLGAEERFSR